MNSPMCHFSEVRCPWLQRLQKEAVRLEKSCSSLQGITGTRDAKHKWELIKCRIYITHLHLLHIKPQHTQKIMTDANWEHLNSASVNGEWAPGQEPRLSATACSGGVAGRSQAAMSGLLGYRLISLGKCLKHLAFCFASGFSVINYLHAEVRLKQAPFSTPPNFEIWCRLRLAFLFFISITAASRHPSWRQGLVVQTHDPRLSLPTKNCKAKQMKRGKAASLPPGCRWGAAEEAGEVIQPRSHKASVAELGIVPKFANLSPVH